MENQVKVILIDKDGKQTEYTKFALYGVVDTGEISEILIDMPIESLCFIEKRLDARICMNLCNQLNTEAAIVINKGVLENE
jgi:muconolactone delta-isomerase